MEILALLGLIAVAPKVIDVMVNGTPEERERRALVKKGEANASLAEQETLSNIESRLDAQAKAVLGDGASVKVTAR